MADRRSVEVNRWGGFALAGLLGAGMLLVSVAMAATPLTIKDKKGDGKGHADIRAATARATTTTLIWTITTYGAFKTTGAPCVNLYPGALSHPTYDYYVVCGTGGIDDYQHGGSAGQAKVSRPDAKTIVYKLPRSLLLHAKDRMAWAIQVRDSPGCNPICDQAPAGAVNHVVQHL